MKTYELHPEAIGDLDEIAGYYRDSGPQTASRLIAEFFAAFDLLAQFPHHGFRRPELTSRPIRFKLVREFLVA